MGHSVEFVEKPTGKLRATFPPIDPRGFQEVKLCVSMQAVRHAAAVRIRARAS